MIQKSTFTELAQVIAAALASRPELLKAILREADKEKPVNKSPRKYTTAIERAERVRARFNDKAAKEAKKNNTESGKL